VNLAQLVGDADEALVHAERELVEARLVGHEGELGTSEGNLAGALIDAGRPAEALPHAEEAVRLIPEPSPRRRFMLVQLARAHAQLGDGLAAMGTVRAIESELVASGRSDEWIESQLDQLRKTCTT
jgi:hypothetical protein